MNELAEISAEELEALLASLRGETRALPGLPRGKHALPAHEVAQRQRWRLIGAVARVTGREGYHRVTVGAICREAGLSTRSFYNTFQSKDEALVAALDAVRRILDATLAELDYTSLDRLIATMIDRYLDLLRVAPDLTRLLLEQPRAPADLGWHTGAVDQYVASLHAVLAAARHRGLPVADDLADTDLVVLIGGINEACLRHLTTTGSVADITALAAALRRSTDRILRRRSPCGRDSE